MRPRILIAGGGTAGSLTANRLHRLYGDLAQITVLDRDDRHVYQPGLLFVPFGLAEPRIDRNELHVRGGGAMPYDVLMIATGASLFPEETEGLTGPGWEERVFTFYTLKGASVLRDALASFDRGRLVANMVDLPIKCTVAPIIEMIADSGAGLYACQASVDMFGVTLEDFVPQLKHIITVGEFYGLAGGGQIIFT